MIGGMSISGIMRQIVSLLDVPVKLVLIVFLVLSLIMLGTLIAEFIERRYITVKAASVVDALKKGDNDIITIISNSSLLLKMKRLLLEITIHKNLSDDMIENLADSLLQNYIETQDFTIKKSDLIIKLGPTFGLLGTLIPLGPGIIALASGDTATLSYSLLAAFDTTVIGLIAASICTVISLLRRKWYNKDRVMLTLIMEAVVESVISNKNNETKNNETKNNNDVDSVNVKNVNYELNNNNGNNITL